MQLIQQQRASGVDIPRSALFGDSAAVNTDLLNKFFYTKTAIASQLFNVQGGIQLGTFAEGEIGIDIILENPEYEPTVEMAREAFYEIDVTNVTSEAERKWKKEQIRHFVDPVAFYGLHYDIKGGIEYRDANGTHQTQTLQEVYDKILNPFAFARTNQIYLDIRNENGYSYNYYGNYRGVNENPPENNDKELGIAEGDNNLELKEYYTQSWPIHIVEITEPNINSNENQIRVSLRINDNEKPLLAGWNTKIVEADVVDPPEENTIANRVYFVNESSLLDILPGHFPFVGFTNDVSIKIPNLLQSMLPGRQIPTIVRLDYIKQIRLNDGADAFPQQNPTDYLFGPITTKIPWDSENNIQWIGTKHYKYYDSSGYGVITFELNTTISTVQADPNNNNTIITVAGDLGGDHLSQYAFLYLNGIGIDANTQVARAQNILSINYDVANNNTIITIEGGNGGRDFTPQLTVPPPPAPPPTILFELHFMAKIDYVNNRFIIENENLSIFNGRDIKHAEAEYFPHHRIASWIKSYSAVAIQYDPVTNNSYINPTSPIQKKATTAILYTGIVSETDRQTNTDNDNVILYALPKFYYQRGKQSMTTRLTLEGGTSNLSSFFDSVIRIFDKVRIYRTTFEEPEGIFKSILINIPRTKFKHDLWLLALTKTEWQTLLTLTENPILDGRSFSNYHLKMCKLILQEGLSRSFDYITYYHYKLVVAGLDTNGNFIEIEENRGIDVYSKDGFIFSSDAYAQTIQEQGAGYVINFRRHKNKKTLKYGFDWMRDEYIKETNKKGGISISKDADISQDEAQDLLKQEYTPIILGGHEYYVPWLSIYHQNAQGSKINLQTWEEENQESDAIPKYQHNQATKVVKLKLNLKEYGVNIKRDNPIIRIETPQGIEMKIESKSEGLQPNQVYAKHAKKAIIKLRCTEKSSVDRKIYAYDDTSGQLVGVLNIFRNQNTYKIPIRFVRVNIVGRIDNKNYTNYNPTHDTWDKHIKKNYIHAKNAAFQSLLDYSPFLNMDAPKPKDIDIQYLDIDVNFGNNNYTIVNHPLPANPTPLDHIKHALRSVGSDRKITLFSNRGGIFTTGLYEIYEATYPNAEEAVVIFVPPVSILKANQNATTGITSATTYHSLKSILLMNETSAKENTIIHEVGHTLALLHPFLASSNDSSGIGTDVHVFEQYKTENIMDYIHSNKGIQKKISFWKWQWQIMLQENILISDE